MLAHKLEPTDGEHSQERSSVVSAFLQDLEKIFRPEDEREETDGPSTDDIACDASQEAPSDSSDIEQL